MCCTFGGVVDLLVPDPEREPAAQTAVRLLTGRPNHPEPSRRWAVSRERRNICG
jgi:hypothetical protein